jgi:hypothetical protein
MILMEIESSISFREHGCGSRYELSVWLRIWLLSAARLPCRALPPQKKRDRRHRAIGATSKTIFLRVSLSHLALKVVSVDWKTFMLQSDFSQRCTLPLRLLRRVHRFTINVKEMSDRIISTAFGLHELTGAERCPGSAEKERAPPEKCTERQTAPFSICVF